MMRFVVIFVLVGGCGLGEGIIKEYLFHSIRQPWYPAQELCRQNSTDLATFSTAEEQEQIVKIFGETYQYIWIGAYREDEGSAWQWSDGAPHTYTIWPSGYPISGYRIDDDDYFSPDCVHLKQHQWRNTACWYSYYFYCYRHLILVNESKTWDEALHYCNNKYTGLASLPYITQVLQAKKEMVLTKTESVWTGLRFLDGRWFWLSGETTEAQDSLPLCSLRPYHCGAVNNKTNSWENRDCNEKLNFLCYWN